MLPADALLAALGEDLPYDTPQCSFKPCSSTIGLLVGAQPGIASAVLHYNRRVIVLGSPTAPFLAVPGTIAARRHAPLAISQTLAGGGSVRLAGFDLDCYLVELTGVDNLDWAPDGDGMRERRCTVDDEVIRWDALVPTRDERDPDPSVPVAVVVRVLAGTRLPSADGRLRVQAADGRIVLALAMAVLDVADLQIRMRLRTAPADAAAAEVRARAWWRGFLGPWAPVCASDEERRVLALAGYTLAMNSARSPGMLARRTAIFPNRGAYPTHFLWDSGFHCLALREFAPGLAEDSLLLLTENLRADGKMAHFLCSTWMRPGASQPPLVGWAGAALVAHRGGDRGLAARLLPALRRNTQWWLAQRMTRFGLISCPEAMETGWDDTPRLDHGPILALDMNAWLILQIRACAELGRLLGDGPGASADRALADQLSRTLIEHCWDAQAEVFRDVLVADGRRLDAITPAAFLPLLAGVLDHDLPAARASIRRWLLAPEHCFGPVPFPTIRYGAPEYVSAPPARTTGHGACCWRGPMWPNVAWCMVEVLDRFGFAAEAVEACRRLWRVLVADGHLNEYFDSRTGAGCGADQQGWTAAVAVAVHTRLARG